MTSSSTITRIPLNTLAIPFGLSGLAAVWTDAGLDLGWAEGVGNALWAIAGIAWVWMIVAHSMRGAKSADTLASQLRHPAQGPIAALVPIVGMLLGANLFPLLPWAGTTMVIASIVAAGLFAGWILASWTTGRLQIDAVHGGYFLPTVAAGLVAATASAEVGLTSLAVGVFAVGILFWVVIFALLLGRLAARPELPPALAPTMAIIVAPPAVAGTAWFAIAGARVGPIEYALAGVTVVMVLMQLFLIPRYRKLRFSLGFWSFTFPFAAVGGYGIEWLELERPVGWQMIVVAIVAGITVLVGTIGVKSAIIFFTSRPQGEKVLVAADALAATPQATTAPDRIPVPAS
jgi:tellurite resistance protein